MGRRTFTTLGVPTDSVGVGSAAQRGTERSPAALRAADLDRLGWRMLAALPRGLARRWDVFFGPTLGAIRAVPSEESKIMLIAIGAFFRVHTTVSAALRHVDRQLVEAGRACGLQTTDALLSVFETWAIRRWT